MIEEYLYKLVQLRKNINSNDYLELKRNIEFIKLHLK